MEDNAYKSGQSVQLEFDLTVAGSPTTDTVTVTVTPPSGTPQNPTVTESPTGVFKTSVTANQAGLWWYSAVGTNNVAVGAGSFVVEDLIPALPNWVLTDLLSAREFVLQDKLDDSQDYRLLRLIRGYSRAVYRYTKREWLPQTSAATRSFPYDGSGILEFATGETGFDARSVTGITLYTDLPSSSQQVLTAPSGSTQGDWRLEPIGGTPEGTYLRAELTGLASFPFNTGAFTGYGSSQYFANRIEYRVDVTGNWGICAALADVPDDVQLATLVAIADAYRNPEGFASRVIGPLNLTEEAAPVPGVSFAAGDLPSESRSLLDPFRARSVNLV